MTSINSRKINYFLAGADPQTCHQVTHLMSQRQQFCCVGSMVPLTEALKALRPKVVDLLFLCVARFDQEAITLLSQKALPWIVILSPTPEFAIRAFEYPTILDYLLLPPDAARFQTTLNRLMNRLGAQGASAQSAAQEQRILIKSQSEEMAINVADIRYIAADGEYSQVCWAEGKHAVMRKSIKQWLAELPAQQYVRIHRNALINLAYFDRDQKLPNKQHQVFLHGVPEPLLVSSRQTGAFHRHLKQFAVSF